MFTQTVSSTSAVAPSSSVSGFDAVTPAAFCPRAAGASTMRCASSCWRCASVASVARAGITRSATIPRVERVDLGGCLLEGHAGTQAREHVEEAIERTELEAVRGSSGCICQRIVNGTKTAGR